MRTLIKDLKSKIGEEVSISGFVETIRNQSKIKFLIIRDVSGKIQSVVIDSSLFPIVDSMTVESVIQITGILKSEKQAIGGCEIEAQSIEILSLAENLPIPVVEKNGNEIDQSIRFDYRWIDLRKSEKQLIFKVWTALENGLRKYLNEANYIQIYAPSLMDSASEGGSEVFIVKYFDRKAYLAQSPQFYKQMAMASGLEKVFLAGPVFRAEPSYTTRHMTEFTGWDFELSYIKDHYDVMAEEEKMIKYGFEEIKNSLGIDIDIPTIPFPKISMSDAKKKLQNIGIKSEREGDLSPEEERELSKLIKAEYGHDFVFVTEYPKNVRAFYHMREETDVNLTKSFDLIYKGIEITTGAQREHRYEILAKQALERGVTLESIHTYLEFFKYGCPPHGGAGLGPGRIIMQLLNLPSIKEATFLPRDVKRLIP